MQTNIALGTRPGLSHNHNETVLSLLGHNHNETLLGLSASNHNETVLVERGCEPGRTGQHNETVLSPQGKVERTAVTTQGTQG
ncbi:hypothetical protein [Streptomyces sp. NPDC059008]|uniref:hypothetical protein n=1 Tax=Streptomyces sp. NPDC059008 TaxID=3346693 RepID=UPI0036CE7DC4